MLQLHQAADLLAMLCWFSVHAEGKGSGVRNVSDQISEALVWEAMQPALERVAYDTVNVKPKVHWKPQNVAQPET